MYIFVRGSDIAFPATHTHTHTHIYIYIYIYTHTHIYIYIYIYIYDGYQHTSRTISVDGENISFDASLKEQYTVGGPLNFVPAAAVL